MSSYRRTMLALTSIAVVIFVCGCSGDSKKKPAKSKSKSTTQAPNLADIQWTKISEVDFTGGDKKDATFIWDVPGVQWDVANEMGRVKGTTTADEWKGTRINLPVQGDDGDLVEVSGDFKVHQGDGHLLIALFGQDGKPHAESLCMLFENTENGPEYRIQTKWTQHSAKLTEGTDTTPGFGDESDKFHKMKMILDRAESKVHYFVDDVFLGTVEFDGQVAPIVNLQMDFESSKAGSKIEIHYDNLMVRTGKRQG